MHQQHRQRMRERFLQNGFDGFALHEILEVLLYYSVPGADTNGIAHALLEQFGSLRGVFNASVEELQEVPGIGLQSAILLKMIPELTRRYATEQEGKRINFRSVSGKVESGFYKDFYDVDAECWKAPPVFPEEPKK